MVQENRAICVLCLRDADDKDTWALPILDGDVVFCDESRAEFRPVMDYIPEIEIRKFWYTMCSKCRVSKTRKIVK